MTPTLLRRKISRRRRTTEKSAVSPLVTPSFESRPTLPVVLLRIGVAAVLSVFSDEIPYGFSSKSRDVGGVERPTSVAAEENLKIRLLTEPCPPSGTGVRKDVSFFHL